jgi:hypothetical protein
MLVCTMSDRWSDDQEGRHKMDQIRVPAIEMNHMPLSLMFLCSFE